MEQKSQDQYLAWMMRYHVQWAPEFRCGSKSAVRRPYFIGSHVRCGIRAGESMENAMECLQQHVCFAERKDRWMDRPTHRQLYEVPGSPAIVEFFRLPSTEHLDSCLFDHRFVRSKVISAWYSECRTPNTQTTSPRCHMISIYNMSKPKIWVMCDTKLSIFEVITKFFWPTYKCPHVVYLKKSQANVLKTGCLVLVPCLATCQEVSKCSEAIPHK